MSKEISDPQIECLKLKKQINDNHAMAQKAADQALERGVLTGELLSQWKELLPHGQFEGFVEKHFDGSVRTAQVYMQAAKRLAGLPKAQRTAVLKEERSIAGLIGQSKKRTSEKISDQGDPSGVDKRERAPSFMSSQQNPASSVSVSEEAADLSAIDNERDWFDTETGGTESTSTEAPTEPSPSPSRNGEKREGEVVCPKCGGCGYIPEPKPKKKVERFHPPTVEQVAEYIDQRGSNVDAEQFVDFYESKGWMVGRNKMKSWTAAVRTWEKKNALPTNGKLKVF